MKLLKEISITVIVGTLICFFGLFPLFDHFDQMEIKSSHEKNIVNHYSPSNLSSIQEESSEEVEEEGEMWRCYYTLKCEN